MAFEQDITSTLDKLTAVDLTDADDQTGFVLDGSRSGWIEIIRARGSSWKVEEGIIN